MLVCLSQNHVGMIVGFQGFQVLFSFLFFFFFFFKPKVMLAETKSAVTKAAANSGDEFSCYP